MSAVSGSGVPRRLDKDPLSHDYQCAPVYYGDSTWDIERVPGKGYAEATGTDVQIIMDALDAFGRVDHGVVV